MSKRLETERLILDKWSVKDAPDLFAYAKNPNVGPAAGWEPHKSVAHSKSIIRNVFKPNGTWKIVWRKTGKPIGTIGLTADRRRQDPGSRELGYSLDEAFWGRGIMGEAVEAVLAYAFAEMGLTMVSVATGKDNEKSRRVIEKAGFRYEGTERRSFRMYDGSFLDERVYSLLKEEWKEDRKQG